MVAIPLLFDSYADELVGLGTEFLHAFGGERWGDLWFYEARERRVAPDPGTFIGARHGHSRLSVCDGWSWELVLALIDTG